MNILNLKPGGNYLVIVTSYNKKGTSQPIHREIETMQPPESQQVEVFPVEEEKDVSWQVGAGVLVGILLCLVVAIGNYGLLNLQGKDIIILGEVFFIRVSRIISHF